MRNLFLTLLIAASFATQAQTVVSYKQSLSPASYGLEFHKSLTESDGIKSGLFANYALHSVTPYSKYKNDQTTIIFGKDGHNINIPSDHPFYSQGLINSHLINVGGFTNFWGFMIELGGGYYGYRDFVSINDPSTPYKTILVKNYRGTLTGHAGVSIVIKNTVRIGASYDSGPNNLSASLGWVIKK